MVDIVTQQHDTVGESLVWDERTAHLVWVDIVGRRIHRLDPASGAHERWPTPDFVTSIGLRDDGGAVVGLRRAVALWEFGGTFETLAVPEPERPGNRLNEGVVGPDGAFWVGTMEDNLTDDGTPRDIERSSGAIHRVLADGSTRRLTDQDIGLVNTLVWLPDGRLVTADTLTNELHTYEHDAVLGTLSERRRFAEPFERGLPDGSCLDEEGFLWNCRVVGGQCLARFAPDGTPRSGGGIAVLVADELRVRRSGPRYALRHLGALHDERGAPERPPGRGSGVRAAPGRARAPRQPLRDRRRAGARGCPLTSPTEPSRKGTCRAGAVAAVEPARAMSRPEPRRWRHGRSRSAPSRALAGAKKPGAQELKRRRTAVQKLSRSSSRCARMSSRTRTSTSPVTVHDDVSETADLAHRHPELGGDPASPLQQLEQRPVGRRFAETLGRDDVRGDVECALYRDLQGVGDEAFFLEVIAQRARIGQAAADRRRRSR